MSSVLIIVNAEVKEGKISPTCPVAIKMAKALIKTINNDNSSTEINIIGGTDLWSNSLILKEESSDLIYCPLTIQLPDKIQFSSQNIFKLCIDIESRREWVKKHFPYNIATDHNFLGDLWLPMVLTEKGVMYGEVIGEGEIPNSYEQPIDFSDKIRQALYSLGYQLLESIKATPAVYLLQFKIFENDIIFDRLWPFPATPAIASIDNQHPDLFACHWHCLTKKPILDLTILPK